MDSEGLFTRQSQLGDEIQRMYRNVKKDSMARKEKEHYFTSRLDDLDELWEEFVGNDHQLQQIKESHKDSKYFKEDYSQTLTAIHKQLRDVLDEGLRTLQNKACSTAATHSSNQAGTSHNGGSQPKPSANRGRDNLKPLCSAGPPNTDEPTSDEVIKLVRRQKRIMASVTRKLQEFEGQSQQIQSRMYYELKIQGINRLWESIEGNDQAIWELAIEPPLDYNKEIYESLEDWVQDVLVSLHERLEMASNNQLDGTTVKSQVKLPQLTLPTFNGDYTKWSYFHDLFQQLIHAKPLSNTEKMFYLTSNLTSEAASVIQHLPICDNNYNTAWELLNNRYNNPRLQCTAFLNKLWDHPPMQQQSASSVKCLHDKINECLRGLENIGISITNWDPLLVHLVIKKMDRLTHALYEASLESPRSIPSMKDVLTFLEKRFQTLEALGKEGSSVQRDAHGNKPLQKSARATLTASRTNSCIVCKKHHPLYVCKEFLAQTPVIRRSILRKHKLCFNCMKHDHSPSVCPSRGCKKCDEKHNSLLHTDEPASPQRLACTASSPSASSQPSANASNKQHHSSLAASAQLHQRNNVLLSTVLLKVSTNQGEWVQCRAILDSGSQLNFVTSKLARILKLPEVNEEMQIQGIGQQRQQAQQRINILIQSRLNNYSTRLEAFILKDIISRQPEHTIDVKVWKVPKNIQLADPSFNQAGPIDMLIGAEIYLELLSIGQIKLGTELPVLQNTVFGWTISGRLPTTNNLYALCGICSEDEQIQQQLEKFWKIEEVDTSDESSHMTTSEQRCVQHFNQNVKRDENGRFIIRLPFTRDPECLGASKQIAFRRFYTLERKLQRDPGLQQQYIQFMREYENLGHMKEVKLEDIKGPHYFLPHHCVIKPDSSTTKLRVVFDASAKTSNNLALNDILHKGPTIQDELMSILLRFRFPRYVFTADIEKMYRQVVLAEADRKYQLIIWRETPDKPIRIFSLCTVTYGLTPAPFLATKCLERLAEEEAVRRPLGAKILRQDFYVDDVMTGCDNLSEALETQQQLAHLVQSGGFKLRKWCANHPQLLAGIPKEDTELQLDINGSLEGSVKTLGLTWYPTPDIFQVKTTWQEFKRVTKRTVLSDIAHIFDPLGFVSPVTLVAKLFIKKLWLLKLDWDAALPVAMHTEWLEFRESLKTLNEVKIPRHIAGGKKPLALQLHAFCDASEKAYGVAVYVRAIHQDGVITVRLLCAKSKLAPAKSVTLPRLELCGAKLAAQLTHRINRDLQMPLIKNYFWTDSEIVLAWINSQSSSYQTFIANRVASIQRVTSPEQWQHVPSESNPADLASRGLSAQKLMTSGLWFHGPHFLYGNESIWPKRNTMPITELEKRKATKLSLLTTPESSYLENINHGNSVARLQRIVGYTCRFIHRLRRRELEVHEKLSKKELNEALKVLVSAMQRKEFHEDLQQFKKHKSVSSNSSLSSLHPFIDGSGIIRVGGRLENSTLTYEAKHPILLPYAHPWTKLIMNDIHIKNCHVGPQALLALTRQRFWPIKGKTIARSIIQRCVHCSKIKPTLMTQLMGNLPSTRVQSARPFINSGVDFCGPIQTHYKLRGKRPQKSYIAVFCCFATKAVHLEVASDLTTETFIGALKRFIARRGSCSNIYCDNATNFVGARNQLSELQSTIYDDSSQQKINSFCQSKGIEFTFMPPRAPHFGGLWEAAVKSAKTLLVRAIASAALTFEELTTVTAEVEAILNSRPITPLSTDPNDLTALTPGHFLIGEPMTASTDPEAVQPKLTLPQRWKLVTHVKNEFWRRWSNEYLCELQHRNKWRNPQTNAKPGMMVIIKDDNLPPLKWQLGRIIKSIEGQDGLVRVVDVKTRNGVLRRPIHKLAPLPVEETPMEATPPTQIRDPPSNQDTAQPKPKRARPSTGSAISLLLWSCMVLPVLSQQPIEITPFNPHPGLYFESVGHTNIITNEWNLVVYYNMSNYWKEFKTINDNVDKIHHLCSLLKTQDKCTILSHQFSTLKEELASSNELLSPPSRIKRAPLNIVGNIAGALFGVLDSEYAEKMSATISNLNANDDHLLQLIKNQTSIVDSTLNIIKHDEEMMTTQLETINSKFNIIATNINNTAIQLRQLELAELFALVAIHTTLMALNFQRTQDAILNVLIDTQHHGRINPQLITPRQIRMELSRIKDYLPFTTRLPVEPDNLLQIYHLASIQGRMTKDNAIFRIKLPLFSSEKYDLYRVIPVPLVINNTYWAISTSTNFLVINYNRDNYYPMNMEEFNSCTRMRPSEYMCVQTHPIYRKGSKPSACEVRLITQLRPSPHCQMIKAESSPHWIQLWSSNNWIYSLKTNTTVNIICDANNSQHRMSGAGIIHLDHGCELRHELVTLTAHNIHGQSVKMTYTPTEGMSDNSYIIQSPPLAPMERLIIEQYDHQEEIKMLKQQVRTLQTSEILPNQATSTNIHQLTLEYTALTLIVLLVLWLSYNKWNTRRRLTLNHQAPKEPAFRIDIGEEKI